MDAFITEDRLFWIALVVGGPGSIADGVWDLVRAWRVIRDGVSAEGAPLCASIQTRTGERYPVVEFVAHGKTHRFTSHGSLGLLSSVRVGTHVPVRYCRS